MASFDSSGRLRALLLALLVLGTLASVVDLLLLEHWEDRWQRMPFWVLGFGLVASIGVAWRPRRWTVRTLQLTMTMFVATGCLGLFQHYRGNEEFELEMRPSLSGLELLREAATGATPLLAPGLLAHLGLLGLMITYKHPLTSGSSNDEPERGETR